ncbi:MAG: hypothetical protein ACRELC_11285 [Gemmatimonadota bacterium]
MAGKQIDFPPQQKEVSWITPFMLVLSLLCIVVVVILLVADVDGPFIGPWG